MANSLPTKGKGFPPASLTGGQPLGIKGYQFTKMTDSGPVQALDCQHLAAGGIQECKPAGFVDGVDKITDPDPSHPSAGAGFSIHDCTAHQALFWFALYDLGSRQRPSNLDTLVNRYRGASSQLVPLAVRRRSHDGLDEELRGRMTAPKEA